MYVFLGIIALIGMLVGSLVCYAGWDETNLPTLVGGIVMFVVCGLFLIIH